MVQTAVNDRIALKNRILQAAKFKQEQIISDFQQRIRDAMATEGNVNEEEYDNHQQSFKAGVLAEVNLLNNELEFVNRELDEIRKIENFKDTVHEQVEFGSVVRTDKGTFFVSTSIEEFEVDGDPVFGLSIDSPLYEIMKGKKVGESFAYKTYTYLIREIF
jgi:vacuolar-type H+-ATPase subunit D/Vma8